MLLLPVKTVRENHRFFSKLRQGSVPTGVSEMGRMRPECKQKKIRNKSECPNVLGNDLAGRVAVWQSNVGLAR